MFAKVCIVYIGTFIFPEIKVKKNILLWPLDSSVILSSRIRMFSVLSFRLFQKEVLFFTFD